MSARQINSEFISRLMCDEAASEEKQSKSTLDEAFVTKKYQSATLAICFCEAFAPAAQSRKRHEGLTSIP